MFQLFQLASFKVSLSCIQLFLVAKKRDILRDDADKLHLKEVVTVRKMGKWIK